MSDLLNGMKAEIEELKTLKGFVSRKRMAEILNALLDHQLQLEEKIARLAFQVMLLSQANGVPQKAIFLIEGEKKNERGNEDIRASSLLDRVDPH